MALISVTRAEREADLSELHDMEAGIRYRQGRKQHILARLARTECREGLTPAGLDKQYVREEVACELRITPDTARVWLHDAAEAAEHFPELTKLLEAGETSYAHWLAFTTVAGSLEPEQKRLLLELVYDKARTQTVVEFRKTLNTALLKLRPISEERSRQAAVAARHVTVKHTMTGMSAMYFDMPTEDAVLSAASIEALALEWSRLPGEIRTMQQLRTDAASYLMRGGAAAKTSIQPVLCVTLDTIHGSDREPGELEIPLPASLGGGIVPVTPDHARALASAAQSWRRFVTTPTGELIDYGRTTYTPPADLARLVKARDRTCTFIGCTRPALRCDLDHRNAWECGGDTCELNIDCLCERHHYLKHNTTWQAERLSDGTRRWTSPGGRVYTRPPATYPVDETRSTTHDPLFRDLKAPADLKPPDEDPPPF